MNLLNDKEELAVVDVVDLGRDDGVVEAAFASWTARSTPRTPGGRAGQDVEIATVPPTVVQMVKS